MNNLFNDATSISEAVLYVYRATVDEVRAGKIRVLVSVGRRRGNFVKAIYIMAVVTAAGIRTFKKLLL
jgi:hypothetical protein